MRKFLVVCLEGFALFTALLAGLFFVAHWKISHGGFDLGFLRKQISLTLEERLADGSDVQLGQIILERDEGEDGPMRMHVYDLQVYNADRQPLLQLPEIAFKLQTSDLLKGRISPRSVEILDADVSITRLADGTFDFGLTTESETQQGSVFDSILSHRTSKPAAERLFEGATFRNTSFLFTDQMTGKIWQTTDARAEVWKTNTGYSSFLEASFLLDKETSFLKVTTELNDDAREVVLHLQTEEMPVSELLSLIVGPEDSLKIQTELTGSLLLALDYEGNLKGTRLDAAADAGTVDFAGTVIEFDHVELRTDYFDTDRRFEIDELKYEVSGNKGTLDGVVSFGSWRAGEPMAPNRIAYDLHGTDLLLDLPGKLQEPLPLPEIEFRGAYLVEENVLGFENLKADFFGKTLEGSLDILLPEKPGQSPGVRSKASFAGTLTTDEVLRGWPLILADGARQWVSANVISGRVSDIEFEMDMPRGAIRPATSIGEESMSLSFKIEDASSYFVPGVTPLSGLSGEAVLGGNSMLLKAEGGRVGDVNVIRGRIDMPNFYPKGSRGIFTVEVEGGVQDILSVIDEEPLGFISEGGFNPQDFSGTGSFDFKITRPLLSYVPIDDYEFFGTGTFSDLSLDNAIGSYDISEGAGTVQVSWDGLDVRAGALLQGTPLSFEYMREFTHTEDTLIKASGIVNAKAADELGFSLRRYVRGDILYELELFEKESRYEKIDIAADLTAAEIRLDSMNWSKEMGAEGGAEITVLPPGASAESAFWRFEDLQIKADDLKIGGEVLLNADGRFLNARLDEILIADRVDLSMTAALEKGILQTDITGRYLNADFFLDNLFKSQSASDDGNRLPLPGSLQVHMDINALGLKSDIDITGFEASFGHDGQKLNNIYMSGNLNQGGYVAATMSEAKDYDIGRQLQAQTDNLGALAQGVFGISSIDGGRADYSATFLNDGQIVGTFTADNFVIANAPLIARLFAAGSLNGLGDLLSGEGISFTDVNADVQVDEGVLNIIDARVTGPSLGVSINGDVDLVLNSFDINGAMAPAYRVNAAFGNLPGLGELFVSREGEGVVAFSYGLNGPIAEPTVTVNTLSLLTPGVFRRIFEPVRANRKSTAELLDQAITASELASQLEFATSAEQLQEMEEGLESDQPDSSTLEEAPEGGAPDQN